MIMKAIVAISAAAISLAACARTVSTGSAECRAGTTVTIPVTVDDVGGVSTVVLAINADTTIMDGLGVEAGALADSGTIVSADDGAGHVCVVIPKLTATSGGGELCRIRYRVREGTTDLYSDVALANVQFCAADGVTDLSVANPVEIANGIVRVTTDGENGEAEVAIASDDGALTEDAKAAIRDAIAESVAAHPEVLSVKVKGNAALIPVTASLGIAPQIDILGTEATATYARPSITITAFDPETGTVRIRVDPGEGNAIQAPLAKGCIHVYGTNDLGAKMRYIGNVEIDLAPYLKSETMGEAELSVDFGDYMFFKVKAETVVKSDGELE